MSERSAAFFGLLNSSPHLSHESGAPSVAVKQRAQVLPTALFGGGRFEQPSQLSGLRPLHAVEHQLLAPGADEDVAVAARGGTDALEWKLVCEHARALLRVGVDQQHPSVGKHQGRAIGERVHRPRGQQPPGQLPHAVRCKPHDLQRVERSLQHRLRLAQHFGTPAIAPLDPAVAGVREHLFDPHRDRRGQKRFELLFWLTPLWHIRRAT